MKTQTTILGKLPSASKDLPADRADDIRHLFRQFGAEPAKYQEIGRDERAIAAQSRWPLLGRLRIGATSPLQPVAQPAIRPAVPATVAPREAAGSGATRDRSLSQLFQRLAGEASLDDSLRPVFAPRHQEKT